MATALALHDAVWTKFDAIVGVNTYDGEVVNSDGAPANPPADGDGRVHAYAVLFMFPGNLYASGLSGTQASLDGGFQVTCVGGDPTRRDWCVDKVRTGLIGTVAIDGQTRLIRAREGDQGRMAREDDKVPPRHVAHIEFVLHAP